MVRGYHLLDFVRQHQNWAAFIVFALSFGESLPFISLVLPFWAVLVGIGTIIAVADPLIFWTIVGRGGNRSRTGRLARILDGYHYRAQIQQMWPLKNHPKLLDKGRVFFKRWGAWGIIIARFSGPLRASVPIVAGIAEMPWLRFQIANWGSAFLWAFALLSPGSWGMKWWTQYFS